MAFVALLLLQCFEVTIPPEEQLNPDLRQDAAMLQDTESNSNTGTITNRPDGFTGLERFDAGSVEQLVGDSGPPQPCDTLCDCNPGKDCINGVCAESPHVQCCSNPLCNQGELCWNADRTQGVCGEK